MKRANVSSKKHDIQEMLYTFAVKFLKGSELEKGMGKGKTDMVKELLKEGLLTKEQIAKVAKISIEKIEELGKDLVVGE